MACDISKTAPPTTVPFSWKTYFDRNTSDYRI